MHMHIARRTDYAQHSGNKRTLKLSRCRRSSAPDAASSNAMSRSIVRWSRPSASCSRLLYSCSMGTILSAHTTRKAGLCFASKAWCQACERTLACQQAECFCADKPTNAVADPNLNRHDWQASAVQRTRILDKTSDKASCASCPAMSPSFSAASAVHQDPRPLW